MARTKQSVEIRREAEILKSLVKDQPQFQRQNSAQTDDKIFICNPNGCESVYSTSLIGDFLKLEYYSDSDE